MRQQKYNASLERSMQLPHVGLGAARPGRSGILGWNLLRDMRLQTRRAWLALSLWLSSACWQLRAGRVMLRAALYLP